MRWLAWLVCLLPLVSAQAGDMEPRLQWGDDRLRDLICRLEAPTAAHPRGRYARGEAYRELSCEDYWGVIAAALDEFGRTGTTVLVCWLADPCAHQARP